MAKNAALEKKALAAGKKSEGMRMLLDADYSVADVKDIFDAPYGFVYGVAKRNGSVTPTPRTAKAKAPAKAAKSARPARPAAKAAPAKTPARKAAAAKTPARRTAKAK